MRARFSLPLWLEIAAAVLVTLALSNAATIFLFRFDRERQFAHFGSDMSNQRIATAANVVLKAPETLRPELVKALSGPGLRLSLGAQPGVGDTAKRDAAIEKAIVARLPAGAGGGVRAHNLTAEERVLPPPIPPEAPREDRPPPDGEGRPPPGMGETLLVSIPAGAHLWLNVRSRVDVPRPPAWPLFGSIGAAVGALLLASLWMGRRVAQPLQRLAEAATLLRRGELRGAVPETGPAPVREAARAFNAMSDRVMTMLKSQRAMMGAVAHDLRTPISVLRFRAELVQDEETRARLNETLNEMQGMTEAVLDAVRFDGTGEAARAVDVATLADSLCADMAEMGADVGYRGDASLTCTCRAAEVRRAVRNLIENALRYGKRARVSAEAREGVAALHVDDDGPGISPADLERVFEPFARLDESRSRDTGGYGLGLSIARLIARGHGGDVVLENRAGGGLRATLTLPLG